MQNTNDNWQLTLHLGDKSFAHYRMMLLNNFYCSSYVAIISKLIITVTNNNSINEIQ